MQNRQSSVRKVISYRHGSVQNAADELDQLLHRLGRMAGQEVLLVGCVEDDNGGHRHLAENKQETQICLFFCFFLIRDADHWHQSRNKLWLLL